MIFFFVFYHFHFPRSLEANVDRKKKKSSSAATGCPSQSELATRNGHKIFFFFKYENSKMLNLLARGRGKATLPFVLPFQMAACITAGI